MHRQSLLSSSANEIVYGIEKYFGFSHTNVIPSLVFVRISPLKYTIIFAFIFLSLFILCYSPFFVFGQTETLSSLRLAIWSSIDGLQWGESEFIYMRFQKSQLAIIITCNGRVFIPSKIADGDFSVSNYKKNSKRQKSLMAILIFTK